MEALTFATDAHHDGSTRFLSCPEPAFGEVVTALLVQPATAPGDSAFARCMIDGEARYVSGSVDRVDAEGRWWRFDLPYRSPQFSYRFELRAGRRHYHINGEGTHVREPTDHSDFRLRPEPGAPAWARDGVFYQVFLDRFCRSSQAINRGRALSRWDEPVLGEPLDSARQFYGGDLAGIAERIGHLTDLGISAVCLTPFFPAPESHRYCASSFEHIDPLLGGDEALQRLTSLLHGRGIRCLGDLTLNHCGSTHEWFRRAQRDPHTPEARMFRFFAHPNDYATFQNVGGLPKFDYSDPLTHDRLYRARNSVLRKWVREPFSLDGWRIDVASMVGRLHPVDVNREVAAGVAAALREERPDAFLFAEIPHDPSLDTRAGAWPGALMDAAFASPVRAWCASPEGAGAPVTNGVEVQRGLRAFAAAMPWQSLVSSVGCVGSHDFARVRSVAGDRGRALLALFLLLTYPSIPMIYAGDELGAEGLSAEAARSPMPWPGSGLPADMEVLRRVMDFVRLRRSRPALTRGGFRWLMASPDALAFERCDGSERVLCFAARAPVRITFPLTRADLAAEPLLADCPVLAIHGADATCRTEQATAVGCWLLESRPR